MAFKVMFIYPNLRGMNMLPPAIGLLSAVLKRAGYEVRLFDTTYYKSIEGKESDSDGSKAERLMARPFKMPHEITCKTTNCFEDFRKEVLEFQPDLLALSTTEDMYRLGIKLLEQVKDLKITTIAGGVFPTFAPDLVLKCPYVDIVCRGEGEDALLELCHRLEKGLDYDEIANLSIKRPDGKIKTNPIKLVDMDKNPLIDMSIFEEARFYRPMGGKVYKMFPVETFRGCPYTCAYCNSPTQTQLHKDEHGGNYLRRKSFEGLREELLFYKDTMKAEYLYFWADTFFSWTSSDFEKFCELYMEIKLPFWCQTRPETITTERLNKLKEIGCARISFGIEHGNEDFRAKHLRRNVPNQILIERMKLVTESGIPYSVNNIMGFPHETREVAFDTVLLNKSIDSSDRNAYPFTPFHGTPLRKECERLGFLKHEDIVESFVVGGSLLDMPQFPKESVEGLVKTFNMYVKFPEDRWPEIRQAEKDTPEGRKIYDALKQEFVSKFFFESDEDFEQAAVSND
ncbi:MAG: B12-binding domain-containing radical SAM protein [Candidatus Omnitrophica bacterium]|nr:B12-binding domain-containing radical SAM protein [Candidatus Omnitrophota bacterium]